ncbi:flavin reductase family protein [Celeribacter indicus]|uniref:Flavin reductase domain-containing FMN-binding protein n=1 Tax=Celeribacter indicus TaxID=1208324 RepID=A0A0B5DUI9_9RHOB|nr:flavin reductase family protein [Celeribacter indicus]AJE44900.1 flavin reductase domain-containing FMN-binding protein [Celeribacter indicus]SDW97702.1 flavin reductase ActVB [Celeribacter indicus]
MMTKDQFRNALSGFPSGVTIVTTTDAERGWCGFTASSFCSVSAEPPLVLVCLADTAECHAAFLAARRWNIHIVDEAHTGLATRFASRGADKFAGNAFEADAHGIPRLRNAFVTLQCRRHEIHASGDHAILVGEVVDVDMTDSAPVFYYRRAFHPVEKAGEPTS